MNKDDIRVALEYGDVGELLLLTDEELEQYVEGLYGELRQSVFDVREWRVEVDVVSGLHGQARPPEKR